MKKILFCMFALGLFSASAFPQQNESRQSVSAASSLYVISAKAGGVNFVQGEVFVARKNGKSGLLLKGDALEIGDKVSSGASGKAEILLNPGSFVRLAENSEFEFKTVSLEDLQVELNSGSAMFEVITDNEFTFAVNVPKAKFFVVKTGVYRVDILADGTSKIEVWKGKAQVDDAYATEVKGGREAVVKGSQVTVGKFDRDEKDALETFSKSRAKELAKANAKLQNQDVRTSLMSSFYRTGWTLNDAYGLWVFNPRFGSFCFLPFGYGWNSPYGFSYPRDIWSYNLPPVIYNPPPIYTNNPPIKVGGLGVKNPRAGREDEFIQPIRPPFTKIQREIGQSPISRDDSSLPSSQQFPSSQFPSPQQFPSVRESTALPAPPPSSDAASMPVLTGPTAPPRKGGN